MDKNLNSKDNNTLKEAFHYLKDSKVPKMTQLVMKWSSGKIKEPKTADNVLLGFSCVAVFISFILIVDIGKGPNIPLPPGTTVIYPSDAPPRLAKLLV